MVLAAQKALGSPGALLRAAPIGILRLLSAGGGLTLEPRTDPGSRVLRGQCVSQAAQPIHLWLACPRTPDLWGRLCDAWEVIAGGDVRIEHFDPAMQDAFRSLVLDGMAERWGSVDESLNTDLDDIAGHYGKDCVLVALGDARIVGTAILLLRPPRGEIVRISVHREYRRRGIAKGLLAELVSLAFEHGINRISVETNAAWNEARNLYEGTGFTHTHTAPGPFGRERFYELVI